MKYKSKFLISESPYAMKFEDRSPEEIAREERCVRGDAWELVKNIYKLKEKDKATLFSPTDEWSLPAASTIKPDDRKFVVDSVEQACIWSAGKTLISAELDTVEVSEYPTMVVTANGEVQAKEEAPVFVREWDFFVKVMLLENTRAVLSLGKLSEEFGYSHHWTSGQNLTSSKMARKFTATYQIMYHSSYLVYQRVPPPASSSQETVSDTEIPATRRSESTTEES